MYILSYNNDFYTIKYKLVMTLGPMKRPNQKIMFPSVSRPRIIFVFMKAASGNCVSWNVNK